MAATASNDVPLQMSQKHLSAPMAPETDTERSLWEDPSRRQRLAAMGFARSLMERLGIAAEQIRLLEQNARVMRALVLWSMEFPLNIRWYQRKIWLPRLHFYLSRWLSLVLGVATVGVMTWLGLFHEGTLTMSQLAVLAAGVFGVMQLFAAGTDPKARLGAFRKARADLKESMFTFAEVWQGRPDIVDVSAGAASFSADFMTALYQEIRTGRKIVRSERDAFFDTFKSATEILGTTTSILDAVRGRSTELSASISASEAPQAARETAVASRIQQLRDKLAEATAQQEALEDQKRRLQERKVANGDLADLQAKIDAAETDRFKAQRLLDAAVKSDVSHSF